MSEESTQQSHQESPQEISPEMQAAIDANDALNRGELPEGNPPVEHAAPDWLDAESARKYFDPKTGEVNYAAMAKEVDYLRNLKGKPAEEPKEEPKEEPQGEAEGEPEGDGEQPSVDFDALASELAEQGTLSDESFKQLEAVGISKDMAQLYVKGLQQTQKEVQEAAFEVAGGKDQYDAMRQWIATNLSPAEVAQFDQKVSVLDAGAVKSAVSEMYAKYADATGSDPALVNGDANNGADTTGFATRQEMMAAINDPAYGKDPKYTAMVRSKLVHTDF